VRQMLLGRGWSGPGRGGAPSDRERWRRRGAAALALTLALAGVPARAAPRGEVGRLEQTGAPVAAPWTADRAPTSREGAQSAALRPAAARYGDYARSAAATLERTWLSGNLWRMCLAAGCPVGNQDWGADSLTYDLYLGWRTTHDRAIVADLGRLAGSAHGYRPCSGSTCRQWSDVPMWDSVAASREYEANGNPAALTRAEHAFDAVRQGSAYYALGACPDVRYQQPFGGSTQLKTLETDSNYAKAALLLFQATRKQAYLDDAKATYAAIRRHFLDPQAPLYTVYLFDDGAHCTQVPHRFFGSANGNMILDGLLLARATGDRSYRDQAIATARAVDRRLADARGIYADLQAENDIGEPLVEAMYALATQEGQPFARQWIVRNMAAAASARTAEGYGRFFDGPPLRSTLTAWQTNGGFALALAAGAIDPNGRPPTIAAWAHAGYVAHAISALPATLTFTGSGIALIGTIGERCCEAGHARVFVDGRETFDRTGIWQNKSSSGRSLAHAVLFAWRWPVVGTHTLSFEPGLTNAKEGGPFLHLAGYQLLGSAGS
jgi:hypothetical protein